MERNRIIDKTVLSFFSYAFLESAFLVSILSASKQGTISQRLYQTTIHSYDIIKEGIDFFTFDTSLEHIIQSTKVGLINNYNLIATNLQNDFENTAYTMIATYITYKCIGKSFNLINKYLK